MLIKSEMHVNLEFTLISVFNHLKSTHLLIVFHVTEVH